MQPLSFEPVSTSVPIGALKLSICHCRHPGREVDGIIGDNNVALVTKICVYCVLRTTPRLSSLSIEYCRTCLRFNIPFSLTFVTAFVLAPVSHSSSGWLASSTLSRPHRRTLQSAQSTLLDKMDKSYTKSTADVLQHFNVKEAQGLSSQQVTASKEKYGSNSLPEEPPTPIWKLILEQFKDQLVIILLGSAAISFVLALLEESDDWTAFVDPAVVSGRRQGSCQQHANLSHLDSHNLDPQCRRRRYPRKQRRSCNCCPPRVLC